MRRTIPVLVLALTLLLAACAPAAGGRRGPAGQDPPRTTVRVENRKFLDVNVYVYSGAQRVRLGTVPGASTQVLTIPPNLIFGMGTLRFQIDPIGGGGSPFSQEITVRAGDEITLVVPA